MVFRSADYSVKRKGLTLVEVLATIFVLAVGMLSILVLFPVGAMKVRTALVNERISLCAANAESVFKTIMGPSKSSFRFNPGTSIDPTYFTLTDNSKIAIIDPLAPNNPFA